MARYFLEVSYKGTAYSGFQIQLNARTIQSEVEKALKTYYRQLFELTGSSRTDAGVHAIQNFFHFDSEARISNDDLYHLNAILPSDIVVKGFFAVNDDAHARFDALSRTYQYHIYQKKNPFLEDRAWFYPYPVDMQQLNEAAALIKSFTNFESFAKKNTQVKTYVCSIIDSFWVPTEHGLMYQVTANRFLRGMVRALVATQLKVGRNKLSILQFKNIIEETNAANADFTAPAGGLFLMKVVYPYTLSTRMNSSH